MVKVDKSSAVAHHLQTNGLVKKSFLAARQSLAEFAVMSCGEGRGIGNWRKWRKLRHIASEVWNRERENRKLPDMEGDWQFSFQSKPGS